MSDDSGVPPWDMSEDQAWQSQVDGWPWHSLGGGDWQKSGTCLHCTHGMTVASISAGVETITAPDPDKLNHRELVTAEYGSTVADADAGDQFFARCDCGEPHTGRPPKLKSGCGRWAYVGPPPNHE